MRASLLAGLVLLAACRHVPPDKAARAVERPEPQRRAPSAKELEGLWVSQTVRGALADLGTFAVYVFGDHGRYTGALANRTESMPLEGSYTYAGGVLTLDGDLEMKATLAGDHLELVSPAAYMELVRPGNPPPVAAPQGP